ncbi:hypothetical protein GCM10023160_09210 [Brachybacterium paraconglomeratum]|uniref:hypothetical protein n=1 Tax=Brachybacterium paraconglomeratum TaxID=173362 RepID=UPI0031EA1BC9
MNPLPSDLFARSLRSEREYAGISAGELSRRIADRLETSVDPTLVERMENQTHVIRLDEAVAAAAALGVSLLELISDEPEVEVDGRIAELSAERAVAEAQGQLGEREVSKARQDIERIDRSIRALAAQRMEPIIGQQQAH